MRVAPDAMATCVLGRVAGGPARPVAVRLRGGRVSAAAPRDRRRRRPLPAGRGQPAAAVPPFGEAYGSATEPFLPGSTLLLYADGLVERPSEHLETGLNRLGGRASALAPRSLVGFCDRLLDELPITGTADVALIALRAPGPGGR
jgi:hypothetical protein